LKINQTVKLVKLVEKSSIVLVNSHEALFSLINAVVDSLYLRRQFETVDQLKRVLLIEWNNLSDFHQQQH